MGLLASNGISFAAMWGWFLIYIRMSGVFHSLPGIGTEQVSATFRNVVALAISVAITLTGVTAAVPDNLAQGGLMVISEFALGYLLGALPGFIIGALTVAGQVTSGVIGLGQANMIDPSLGEHVAILARIGSLIGTLVFLAIDGHHTIIRAAANVGGDIGLGLFHPNISTATLLASRFSETFELAVTISAPILVTILITEFVLGLITKFVPQVNIFIISLPLTIGIGLYITAYTFPGVADHLAHEFSQLDEQISKLVGTTIP